MFTIPNQSSVAKAFTEFDEAGRMKPSSYYDRLVDVMEELMKFTLLLGIARTILLIDIPSAKSPQKSCPSVSISALFSVITWEPHESDHDLLEPECGTSRNTLALIRNNGCRG